MEIVLVERPVCGALEGSDPVDDLGFAAPIPFGVGERFCVKPIIASGVDPGVFGPVGGNGEESLGHRFILRIYCAAAHIPDWDRGNAQHGFPADFKQSSRSPYGEAHE